ncbi:MAG: hypothetical protein ACTTKH_07050 [Treponema sp.]
MDILSKPIGAGPYKLQEFVNGSYVHLVAFDNYVVLENLKQLTLC